MESFNFVIKGKSYSTKPLVVGNVIDLWRLRSALSGGTYGHLYRMALDGADQALVAIDIEAFVSIFSPPQLLKDLKVESIRDLGIEDYMELNEIYIEQIKPWLDKVEGMLKKKEEKTDNE